MIVRGLILAGLAVAALGCNDRARRANIDLRNQVAQLEQRNGELERHIAALQAPTAKPATLPTTMPADVITTTDLLFGKLTAVRDQTLEVYIVPTDRFGDEIKASGNFRIELYDLDRERPKVAQWEFDPEAALDSWTSLFTIYGYVLECPLDTMVEGELTVRVDFTETLTGRRFTEQMVINVE
ncbi:MAG: hypothetical protein AAF656_13735 [Planctomycetota bacterium]